MTGEDTGQKHGWLNRLTSGLRRTSSALGQNLGDLFSGARKLDRATLDELEELLIATDIGVSTAAKLTRKLAEGRFDQEITGDEVRAALAAQIAEILSPVAEPLAIDPGHRPHTVLVCGVNGSGKTTTVGKLAQLYRDQGLSVMLAAADTFRAAAVEQLQIWGERTGAPVVARETGADAAGLVFDAIEEARRQNVDLLLIDTAGRLQNKTELMDELKKVIRVAKKLDETAPHSTLLVLDATVGQNAHSQVETFRDMVDVTGLAVTKLDGSAKAGVVVALAERFGLPIHAIGVGEQADDLRPFDATSFARALVDLGPEETG